MTGLVRRATLITAVGLLAASAAMAGVPSASTSIQPTGLVIKIVGHGSPPDPIGTVSYTIRDASNNPVPGSVVILNFAACADVRICSSDVGTGMTVNCGSKTVTGVTNASGQVSIVVAGSSGGGAPSFTKCVAVTADGVPYANLNGATADYNALDGVTLLDVSSCYGDVVAGTGRKRSDFDGNGTVALLDVSAVYGIVVGGGSPFTCTTLCP
jgi:hypothetical protein